MTDIAAYIFYFIAASASPLWLRWLAVHHQGDKGGQIDFAARVTLIIAILSLSLLIVSPIQLTGSLPVIALIAIVGGIFNAGFYVCSYVAQKHVDAGVAYVLNNIYTPVAIVLATVFLHEKLVGTQILGAFLLLSSMVIISKKHQIGRFTFDKYFWLMILSGTSLGVFLTLFRQLQKVAGFTGSFVISAWALALCMALVNAFVKQPTGHTSRNTVIAASLQFSQNLAWSLLLFIIANLSVVSAVTTFKAVIVFVLAAVILHERDHVLRKVLGSILAVIGLLLMR